MSSLISRLQTSEPTASSQPRVVALRSDEVDPIFETLSSETRRDILKVLYERPSTPSELAQVTETSLQNVHYHIQKLAEVELIESVDTRYSEKGKEMSVYAPANDPLIFVESEETRDQVESRLDQIVGILSLLAIGSLVIQKIADMLAPTPTLETSGGSVRTFAAETAANATVQMDQAAKTSTGLTTQLQDLLLEPGMLVFLGGILALITVLAMRWMVSR